MRPERAVIAEATDRPTSAPP